MQLQLMPKSKADDQSHSKLSQAQKPNKLQPKLRAEALLSSEQRQRVALPDDKKHSNSPKA